MFLLLLVKKEAKSEKIVSLYRIIARSTGPHKGPGGPSQYLLIDKSSIFIYHSCPVALPGRVLAVRLAFPGYARAHGAGRQDRY